jgi:hypothetical protein
VTAKPLPAAWAGRKAETTDRWIERVEGQLRRAGGLWNWTKGDFVRAAAEAFPDARVLEVLPLAGEGVLVVLSPSGPASLSEWFSRGDTICRRLEERLDGGDELAPRVRYRLPLVVLPQPLPELASPASLYRDRFMVGSASENGQRRCGRGSDGIELPVYTPSELGVRHV